jgi:two-component system, NarL family, response regulator LiaR
MTQVRVAIIDDHRVVTESLKAWLESFPDITVVGVASSGEAALAQVAAWRPDVILQDLLMPGGIDGITTTTRLRAMAPSARIIALTASIDEPRMMGVLRAGAAGYVRKNAEPETLIAAVRAVAHGRTFIDPAVATILAAATDTPTEQLTTREIDVLRQVTQGLANRDIAIALGIGEETVKSHVAHILAKLRVENRAQALVEALRRRLISPEDLD